MAVFVAVGGHVGELELFYTVVIGDRGHAVIRQGGDRHEAHHQRRRQTHGQQGAQFGFLHSMSPPHFPDNVPPEPTETGQTLSTAEAGSAWTASARIWRFME